MSASNLDTPVVRQNVMAQRAPGAGSSPLPPHLLAWLALAPVWPETVAARGFPLGGSGMGTGAEVGEMLARLAKEGTLKSGNGEPPWRGRWYWMERAPRKLAIEQLLTDASAGGVDFVRRELARIGEQLRDAPPRGYPPALSRFAKLAGAAASGAAGIALEEEVGKALARARERKDPACPEAYRWIEAAEPLVRILGADLQLTHERAQRRLELFERRRRDERFLDNYTQRTQLEKAFEELLSDSADDSWALHYVGDGGMGKTMLVRRIASHYAETHRLVTTRIDFDHINPDYPSHAPGLLLMALAEDLTLHEDNVVAELLRKFNETIRAAHASVEASQRSGTIIGATVQNRLDEAERLFIDVLTTISLRSRVVLILDTCEELARLRPDGKLPDSVVRTFELLERLHAAVPSLRVVFSGRRPLAASGHGWSSGAPGEHREYLRRAVVQGFDEEECERFFRGYDRGERPVDRQYWEKIQELSAIDSPQPAGHVAKGSDGSSAPRAGRRFNPYDLDLYAEWVTSEGADTEKLLNAGRHYYARERIVARVAPQVRRWIPHLVRVRIFDEDLLQRLGVASVDEYRHVPKEITDQEWIDVARGAQWTDGEDEARIPTTWRVDPNIARRLESYYLEQEPAVWADAERALRDVLPPLVIRRPWRELTPEYVVAAAGVLAGNVERGLAWWCELEAKIFTDRRWKWGREILEQLRHREWPKFMIAAMCATEAAMLAKERADGRRLQERWGAADDALQGLADSPCVARLRYRARAGCVSALRWTATPLSEDEVLPELTARLALVPKPPLRNSDGSVDLEIAATEIGLIDNTIEALERVAWRGVVPQVVVQRIAARTEGVSHELPDAERTYLELRLTRLQHLGGNVDAFPKVRISYDALHARPRIDLELAGRAYIDWSPPQDLSAWLSLESFRLYRFRGANPPGYYPAIVEKPNTLDSDRMLSAWTLWISDNEVPEDPDDAVIEASLALNASAAPQYAGHREVPPYFQVALMLRAGRGRINDALEFCNRIAEDATRPLDVRRAAERVKVTIAAHWRLREQRVASQTSLETSTEVDDHIQIAGAAAYDPASPDYAGRWKPVLDRLAAANVRPEAHRTGIERWHAWLDDIERGTAPNEVAAPPFDLAAQAPAAPEYRALCASPAGIAAELRSWALGFRTEPHLPCGDRLAAKIALEEGALLAMRRPQQALRLLELAAVRFKASDDALGSLLTAATTAVCLASCADPRVEEAQREVLNQQERCMERGVLSRRVLDNAAASPGPTSQAADGPVDVWLPWAMRIAALQDRDRAAKPRRWANALPPDMRWLEPSAVRAPDAATPATPKGVSSLRWLALVLGLFATLGSIAALFVGSVNEPVTGFFQQLIREYNLPDDTQGMTATFVLLGGAALVWLALTFRNRGDTPLARVFQGIGKAASTTFAFVFGLLLVIGGLGWLYRGFDWVLGFSGVDLHVGWKVALFAIILGVLGNIVSIYRKLLSTVEKCFRFKYVLVPTVADGIGRRSRLLLRAFGSLEGSVLAEADPFVPHAFDDIRLYVDRAISVPIDDVNSVQWRTEVFRALHMVASVEVAVPRDYAGTPWEALIASRLAPGSQSFTKVPYRFRRTSEADSRTLLEEWFSAKPAPPFPRGRMIVKVDARTTDPVLLRDQWQNKKGALDAKFFAVLVDDGEIAAQVAQGGAVGVLHVLDEVLDTERGLAIRLRGETQLFASEVIYRYPHLRLVILQLPWRPDMRRFRHDRLETARARRFAAQLHEAGVPAVIVLPSIPEAVGLDALRPIVRVVAKRSERSATALTSAVHAAAVTIASAAEKQLAAADAKPQAPAEANAQNAANAVPYGQDLDRLRIAAAETAFDACLYCRSDLSLALAPVQPAAEPRQKAQPEQRS